MTMGNDYSIHKNRTYSYEEGMTFRVRNNLHSLRFHSVHGDNVKLSKNGAVACRSEGFCKGIVFSNRPVLVREAIYIKFLEISSNWSGALRIGFTMNDPVTVKSKLPRYACPDLTAMHGNWAKAIAERLAKKDSVLFYYVDPNGDVHYGIDAEEYGVFFGGVNTSGKLWAVLDIYGNTVAVEFIDPSSMNQDCQNEALINSNSILRNKASKSLSPADALNSRKLNPLSFHHVHGRNVTLKQNGVVVSRKQGFHSHGYAFTERPLKLEEKVVLQVCQTDLFYQGTLIYGVTSCDPSNLNSYDLPENADDLLDRPEYWVFSRDSSVYHSGDIIVYSISNEGEVKVSKNNSPVCTVLHVDSTQPLWLFVDLHGSTSEVCIVGTTDNFYNFTPNLGKILDPLKVSLPPGNAELKEGQAGPSSQSALAYNECVICYEQPVNCALYRCGHMCMCHECAMKFWKPESNVQCPICRKTIQDVIKIYR